MIIIRIRILSSGARNNQRRNLTFFNDGGMKKTAVGPHFQILIYIPIPRRRFFFSCPLLLLASFASGWDAKRKKMGRPATYVRHKKVSLIFSYRPPSFVEPAHVYARLATLLIVETFRDNERRKQSNSSQQIKLEKVNRNFPDREKYLTGGNIKRKQITSPYRKTSQTIEEWPKTDHLMVVVVTAGQLNAAH